MKISIELINTLIKVTREIEKLNSTLNWYENKEIIKNQILSNELYYAQKIKNQDIKKISYYEKRILNKKDKYEDLLVDTSERIKLRNFNENFISEMQRGLGYELYEVYEIAVYEKEKIDYLINASELYYEIYNNYPNNNHRAEFACPMTNAYLAKKLNINFVIYFSEVINSNNPLFKGTVIDDKKWTITFLKLLHGQVRKNNERIKNTDKLIRDNHELFRGYSENIEKYINKETVFTITDFIENNKISYNTGKKYLKDLVDKGILQPIKIGKHNAFVYQDMYDIWLK